LPQASVRSSLFFSKEKKSFINIFKKFQFYNFLIQSLMEKRSV